MPKSPQFRDGKDLFLPPNSEMDGGKHVDPWDSIYSIVGSHVGFGVSWGPALKHYIAAQWAKDKVYKRFVWSS